MFNFIKKFDKKDQIPENKFSDKEYEKHYELKLQEIENILGKMNELVGHAIIPFQIGGAVDMYYFEKAIPGTAFATFELIEPDGTGPLPNSFGTYELLAFTNKKLIKNRDKDATFNKIERRICGIFTSLGFYSSQVVLNPKETVEIPGKDDEENICIILDEWDKKIRDLISMGTNMVYS